MSSCNFKELLFSDLTLTFKVIISKIYDVFLNMQYNIVTCSKEYFSSISILFMLLIFTQCLFKLLYKFYIY